MTTITLKDGRELTPIEEPSLMNENHLRLWLVNVATEERYLANKMLEFMTREDRETVVDWLDYLSQMNSNQPDVNPAGERI